MSEHLTLSSVHARLQLVLDEYLDPTTKLAHEINGLFSDLYTQLGKQEDRDAPHCVDCCCARLWKAFGITESGGESIVEKVEHLIRRTNAR